MKIAVTGSHGYIGTNLCRRLEQSGHAVRCYDYRISRPYIELPYENLPFDAILHLAAFSNVAKCDKTSAMLASNVTDLALMMEGLRGFRGAFVFVSSSAVYALPESGPYGLTKALGEVIVRNILPRATVVRPFNVIGGVYPDSLRNDHLIPKLMEAKINRTPFHVYGAGLERRYYVHVDFVVDAIIHAMKSPGATLDVLSNRGTKVMDVVEAFSERWPIDVVHTHPRRDNPTSIEPDGLAFQIVQETDDVFEKAFGQLEVV